MTETCTDTSPWVCAVWGALGDTVGAWCTRCCGLRLAGAEEVNGRGEGQGLPSVGEELQRDGDLPRVTQEVWDRAGAEV